MAMVYVQNFEYDEIKRLKSNNYITNTRYLGVSSLAQKGENRYCFSLYAVNTDRML
jgi:phosphatidylethanolamine-binding protein (PEBP) family uncharacterized protein